MIDRLLKKMASMLTDNQKIDLLEFLDKDFEKVVRKQNKKNRKFGIKEIKIKKVNWRKKFKK